MACAAITPPALRSRVSYANAFTDARTGWAGGIGGMVLATSD
jgi:hypothetical protein